MKTFVVLERLFVIHLIFFQKFNKSIKCKIYIMRRKPKINKEIGFNQNND